MPWTIPLGTVLAGWLLSPEDWQVALLIGFVSVVPPLIAAVLITPSVELWFPKGIRALFLAVMLAGTNLWLGSEAHAAFLEMLTLSPETYRALILALARAASEICIIAAWCGGTLWLVFGGLELVWVRPGNLRPLLSFVRASRPLIAALLLLSGLNSLGAVGHDALRRMSPVVPSSPGTP
jgi:hypothetical protein